MFIYIHFLNLMNMKYLHNVYAETASTVIHKIYNHILILLIHKIYNHILILLIHINAQWKLESKPSETDIHSDGSIITMQVYHVT